MTREEAIAILTEYRKRLINSVSNQLDKDIEAFDMAIKALEGQYSEMLVLCDNCGHAIHVKFEEERGGTE